MPDSGVGLGARLLGHDRAVLATAPEVIAHQVDDHHVLGAVLERGDERIAFDQLLIQAAGAGARPLDRLGANGAALATKEPLGRQT
jgi:hypothetical protein